MQIIRHGSASYFTAHSQLVLDNRISPTARLLYVVLLARLDEPDNPRSFSGLAPVLGLEDDAELAPLIDELDAAGVVDRTVHHGQEPSTQIYIAPAQGTRTTTCQPCRECGLCACPTSHGVNGQCRVCWSREQIRRQADEDIARWQQLLDAGAVFAYGQHSRLLHRWDCALLNQPDKSQLALEESLADPDSPGHWPRLPDLYTASELRRKKHRRKPCQNCKPDPL